MLTLRAVQLSDRQRLTALCILTLLILALGKAVTEQWINWNLWAVLLPIAMGMGILTWLSPPTAAAFYFLGNYFFGSLSIFFYPSMSFLTVLAAVLIGSLLLVRWQRGELARFLLLPKRVWLALAALALFFLLGFARAVWEVDAIVTGPGHSGSFRAALRESLSGGMRGNGSLLIHYMFLSHWLTFLAIGALACLSWDDLKTFFLSFGILIVVQVLPIPIFYFPQFFQELYVECQPLGLAYGQINRGNFGYMTALASSFVLTMSYGEGNNRRVYLLAWWLVLAGFTFLSASKGPILAWMIATAYILWRGSWLETLSYRTLVGVVGVFIALGLLAAATGYSIVPCGTVKKLVGNRFSADVRVAMIRDRLGSYLPIEEGVIVNLPDGRAVRLSAENALQYRILEEEARQRRSSVLSRSKHLMDFAEARQLAVRGPAKGDMHKWLFGEGLGGSNRSVDYKNKSFQVHAGSLNLFIDLFIETGVIGLLLLAFAVTVLCRHFQNSVLSEAPTNGGLLAMSLGAMALVVLVKINLAAETPTEDVAALMIGLLVGMATTSTRGLSGSRSSPTQGRT